MSGLSNPKIRRLAQRRQAILARADRDAQLSEFYERASTQAAAKGEYEAACRHLTLAGAFQRSATAIYRELRAADDALLEAYGYRHAPPTNGTRRPRDAAGRYVARPNGNGRPHRNGNGRARAHHDGARSSARSGDSSDDDPEPEHGRLCRCDRPLVLADTWAGPRWSRCLWCGHDAREVVL